MINLAIIISVSDYYGDVIPLPGCKNDGAAIAALVNEEQGFAETLVIDSETSSGNVKQRLIDFVAKHKQSEVGNIFFYFTGHGDFHGGEFYYLLSDYTSAARKQTSLENTELDNLVRSLRPALFAKVVDACHSGVSYVKDGNELQKHLNASINAFNKIYFMFSSQLNQLSYQDNSLSYFTKKFIDSIARHKTGAVRYKDIIDYVSDAFAQDTVQTPFFVTQADHTEIFLEVPEVKRKALAMLLPPSTANNSSSLNASKKLSLVDYVKLDAELYCSEEQTMRALEQLSGKLESYKLPTDLAELYSLECERIPLSDFKYGGGIGIWIDKNLVDKRYLVTPEKETRPEPRKVLKNPWERLGSSASLLSISGDGDFKIVTDNVEHIVGFKPTVELPFGAIAIFAEPKYLNLFACQMYVVPIVSMTHIRLFWSYLHLDHSSWKHRRFVNKFEWVTDEAPTKDEARIDQLLHSITLGFENFVLAPLKSKWGKFTDQAEKASSGGIESQADRS